MSEPLPASRSVEVFVVDAPHAAMALGAVRTSAESTHVLCRHADEGAPDFTQRILRRIERIQKNRQVGALWYVVGSEGADGRCALPLLNSLVPLLDAGSRLTVVGPRQHQAALFGWLDSVMQLRHAGVVVGAQLYEDGPSLAAQRSVARPPRHHSLPPPSSRSPAGTGARRAPAWVAALKSGAAHPSTGAPLPSEAAR